MKNISVKDFILDIENYDEDKDGVVKVISKPSVEYKIVLENDMDFVIKRTTSKTDKDLVFLVSQDLYYIKDNKNGSITKLDKNNVRRVLGNFHKDSEAWLDFTKVQWTKNSMPDSLSKVVSDSTFRDCIKYGIDVEGNSYILDVIINCAKKNNKLLRYYDEKIGIKKCNKDLLKSVYKVHDDYDYNNSVFFIDMIADLDIKKSGYYYLAEMIDLTKTYKFDTNTFLEYIIRNLHSQGISCWNSDTYSDYRDYLRMNQEMYGKVKVKYPKYMRTEHDKTVMRYNLWNKYKNDLAMFRITPEHKKLEFSDKEYSIILPETSADIVAEGINNSNCVASYVKKVAEGLTTILFMRDNRDLTESLVTVEVKGDSVVQVKGYANRPITKIEDRFIKKWAKANTLKIKY